MTRVSGRKWMVAALASLACVGTASVATARSNVVVTADDRGGNGAANGKADQFRLVREGDAIALYLDGVRSRAWRSAALDTLTVDGSSDDDTLTVDFTGGNPIPRGGIHYNGGDNGPAGDVLRLVGDAPLPLTYRFFNRTDGAVDVGGASIVYTGLEPVMDSVPGPLTVNGTNAPNSITCLAVQAGNFGEIAVDDSEVLEFFNKTTLTVDAMGGDDHIYVGPFGAPGLTSVVVHAGPGDDVVSVAAGVAQPVAIFGDDGDDLIKVAPSPNAAISVDGGGEVIGDHLIVATGAAKAKKTAQSVTVDGMQDVTFSNFEQVDVVGAKAVKKFVP